jgi:hypothetical protein
MHRSNFRSADAKGGQPRVGPPRQDVGPLASRRSLRQPAGRPTSGVQAFRHALSQITSSFPVGPVTPLGASAASIAGSSAASVCPSPATGAATRWVSRRASSSKSRVHDWGSCQPRSPPATVPVPVPLERENELLTVAGLEIAICHLNPLCRWRLPADRGNVHITLWTGGGVFHQ